MLEQDNDNTGRLRDDPTQTDRRRGRDRRCQHDQRNEVRYESPRRKNHGRRQEDKDPWKESLNFE